MAKEISLVLITLMFLKVKTWTFILQMSRLMSIEGQEELQAQKATHLLWHSK